ncbi:MAG: hypothetical protein ABW328_17880 [Ilumatobacteraceae bacterium]
MTSTATSSTTAADVTPAPAEQLRLLPDALLDAAVPLRFRLDEATRRRGLRHIAEIRARLAATTDERRPAA